MSISLQKIEIKTFINQNFQSDTLLIVPGLYHEHYFENLLLNKSSHNCIPGGKVLRLEDLFFRILYGASKSVQPIPESLKDQILRSILLYLNSKNEITYFKSISDKKGLLRHFSEAISSLKQARVRPLDLEMIVADDKNFLIKNKIEDLKKVYEFYESFLKQKNLYDKENCFEEVLDISNNFNIEGINKLIILNFLDFTSQEIELLNHLSVKHEIILSDMSPKCISHFPFLKTETAPAKDNSFTIKENFAINTFSRNDEVKEIAYFILDKVTNSNAAFTDFSIVIKNKSFYMPVIKEILSNYNIPIDLEINQNLTSYPLFFELKDLLKKYLRELPQSEEQKFQFASLKDYFKTVYLNKMEKDSLLIPSNIKVCSRFFEILNEVEQIIKALDLPLSYSYFFEIFDSICEKATIKYEITSESGVKVLSWQYADCADSKYVFIPDFIDGVFPKSLYQNTVLDDKLIFYLKEVHGYNLDTSETESLKEEYLLNRLVSDKSKQVIFTFPAQDIETAKPFLPSEYLKNNKNIGYRSFFDTNYLPPNTENEVQNEDKKIIINIPQNSFSPTSLEIYLSCPYKYFLNKIVKIDSIKEVKIDIDPIHKGSVLHKTLELFFKEHDGFELIKNSPEQAKVIILKLFNGIFLNLFKTETTYNSFLKNHLSRKLINFISKEHKIYSMEKLKPSLFEVKLSISIRDLREYINDFPIPDELLDIKLDAVIDRIDIDSVHKIFGIIDYKLKNKDLKGIRDIDNGKKLQLPTYIMISQKYEKLNDYTFSHAFFYKLFDLDTSEGLFISDIIPDAYKPTIKKNNKIDDIKLKEILAEVAKKIIVSITSIRDSKFDKEPIDKKTCEKCELYAICRTIK